MAICWDLRGYYEPKIIKSQTETWCGRRETEYIKTQKAALLAAIDVCVTRLPASTQLFSNLVRAKGIEPSPKAWEAFVLPLYYARRRLVFYTGLV